MSGHHESGGGGDPYSEMGNFIAKIFSFFWDWLDDEVPEMIDKPRGGHGH